MKAPFPLSAKILLCALINLVLLVGALLVFARMQLQTGLQSLLLAPGHARLRALGDEIEAALEVTPKESRERLLAHYAGLHGVDLVLFAGEGEPLAGPAGSVPAEVLEELRRSGPPHGPPPWLDLPKERRAFPNPELRRGVRPVFLVRVSQPTRYWFGIRMPIRAPGEQEIVRGTLIVGASSILATPLLFDIRPWLGIAVVVGGITLVCWLPLIRDLRSAIRQITQAAGAIAEGKFDVHVTATRRDELGQLGAAINRMASQLAGFVRGQKRFLGDIAHELCSPISRMQLGLGILEQRAEPQQRQYVADVLEEAEHMSALVNELLSFSKAGLQPEQAERSVLPLAEVVAQVLEREVPENVSVTFHQEGELKVLAYPESLDRALSNVVRNAVRYDGQVGPISISARAEGPEVVISVADHGPGIPEEDLERVFTPFYRLDRARARESGGVGLGLAIVKASVEASGGSVLCRNRKPSGLEVLIKLKAA